MLRLRARTRPIPVKFTHGGGLLVTALLLGSTVVACATEPTAAPSAQALPTATSVMSVPSPTMEVTTPPSSAPTSMPTSAATAVAPDEQQTSPVESSGPTENGQPLAARVNGQPIYFDAFQKQVVQTESALAEQGILLEGTDGEAQRAQVQENVLKGLIEQVLIEQAATAMQIRVTDEELNTSLEASAAQSSQSMETWLIENNMTMEELREMQRSQLITSKVIEKLSEMVPNTAEQVHARHIFTVDRSKAEDAAAQLATGEAFASVAQDLSEDFSTAPNGGDLGWFPRETPMMPPVVMDIAFTLQPGQNSSVVESEIGFHIVRVEAKETNRPLTQDMLIYVRQKAFRSWLDQQISDATVERYAIQ
jgi:parvulin-like peptidyl-prolyl isomerase